MIGEGPTEISDERRVEIKSWLADDDIIQAQVINEMRRDKITEMLEESEDPLATFDSLFSSKLSPIQEYRAAYDQEKSYKISSLPIEAQKEALRRKNAYVKKLRGVLRRGIEDARVPMDKGRRAYFERTVADSIPNPTQKKFPEYSARESATYLDILPSVFFSRGNY